MTPPTFSRRIQGEFKSPEDFLENDFRRLNPRFQVDNFKRNLEVIERVRLIAAENSVTPSQLSLAWLLTEERISCPFREPSGANISKRTLLQLRFD